MHETLDRFMRTFEEMELQKYGRILSKEERDKISEAQEEEERQRKRQNSIDIKMMDFRDKVPPSF